MPDNVTFATKSAMACEMTEKLLGEGAPSAFVLTHVVYSSDYGFPHMLEDRGQPYALAVRSTHNLHFLEERRWYRQT